MVGSGNLDCRSFFLNFELSLLLYGQTITKRLRECQQEYLDGSEHLELSRWVAQPAWRNVLRDIAALFGPIL
jgi:cardiolipin synthase